MSGFRIELETDDELTKLAQELREFVPKRLYRRIARDLVPATEKKLDDLINRKLRPYPPPRPDVPFVWSTDPAKNARGRRGFFARYPNGFKRDGSLGRTWEGEINFSNGELTAVVSNKNAGASWTLGDESHNYQQVPSHALLWDNAGESIPPVLIEVVEFLNIGTEEIVDEELERVLNG
jgi:hypothetical protein